MIQPIFWHFSQPTLPLKGKHYQFSLDHHIYHWDSFKGQSFNVPLSNPLLIWINFFVPFIHENARTLVNLTPHLGTDAMTLAHFSLQLESYNTLLRWFQWHNILFRIYDKRVDDFYARCCLANTTVLLYLGWDML